MLAALALEDGRVALTQNATLCPSPNSRFSPRRRRYRPTLIAKQSAHRAPPDQTRPDETRPRALHITRPHEPQRRSSRPSVNTGSLRTVERCQAFQKPKARRSKTGWLLRRTGQSTAARPLRRGAAHCSYGVPHARARARRGAATALGEAVRASLRSSRRYRRSGSLWWRARAVQCRCWPVPWPGGKAGPVPCLVA